MGFIQLIISFIIKYNLLVEKFEYKYFLHCLAKEIILQIEKNLRYEVIVHLLLLCFDDRVAIVPHYCLPG